MIQAKIKQVLINILFIVLAFTGAELCISPAPVFVGNAQSAFNPYVFLRLYPWEECGDVLRRSFRPFTGPFLQRAFFLFIPAIIYLYRLCQRHFYQVLLRRLHHLPLILSIFNGIWYSMYIYIFRFLIRGRLNLPYYFRNIMLPEIIFTAVTTLLIYRLFLSASRRVEDIGKRRDTKLV